MPNDGFDKYAVVLDPEQVKMASSGNNGACPNCGSTKVDYHGLTPICPRCGSKPWERANGT